MRVRFALLVTALMVGGCTQSRPPAESPAVPAFSSARPSSAAERTVPDSCDAIATLDDLTRILNNFVSGPVQRIVGVPQQNIGRTGRLDCYYGLPDGQPATAAKVWVGLAGYVNEESARKRLTATVADERDAGTTVSVSDVPVGDDRGVLIHNANWMIVAARGRLTVVVQVVPDLVREDHAGVVLGQVADFALSSR